MLTVFQPRRYPIATACSAKIFITWEFANSPYTYLAKDNLDSASEPLDWHREESLGGVPLVSERENWKWVVVNRHLPTKNPSEPQAGQAKKLRNSDTDGRPKHRLRHTDVFQPLRRVSLLGASRRAGSLCR